MFWNRKSRKKPGVNTQFFALSYTQKDPLYHLRTLKSEGDLHLQDGVVKKALCGVEVSYDLSNVNDLDRLETFHGFEDDEFSLCNDCYSQVRKVLHYK